MTYIDYINQFWQTQANVEFSSNEAFLYFFLLKECNLRGWENPFECSNRRIVLSIGISEPTLIDCRNRLQQKGLIQFEAGRRKAKSPVYYLNDLRKPLSKTFSKSLSKTFSKSLSSNKDKRIKNNNSSELFAPAPTREEVFQPTKKKVEFTPPTLDGVKNYFMDKMPDWERQAEIFFYHFDSLGWRNINGAKIERWESRANLWIIDELQKQQQNEDRITKDDGSRVIPITVETSPQEGGGFFNRSSEELEELINSIPIGG